MNIESRVIECIAKVLCVPVHSGNKFSDFAGFDSLDQVTIIMQLEQEFDCRINEDEMPPCTTVQELIDYVRANHVKEVVA